MSRIWRLFFHLITHSVKSLLGHLGMSSWSISSRAFLSSVCGPTMLVLWSDLILHTGHHLAMNFRTVFIKEFISSKCAVFICTPLLANHVNSTLWRFTSFMPCFVRNLITWQCFQKTYVVIMRVILHCLNTVTGLNYLTCRLNYSMQTSVNNYT